MNSLFKNSKKVLSFVVAFAVLAMSLFTGGVFTSEAATCDDTLNVVYADPADLNLPAGVEAFMTEHAGTETDPIVISTAGELRYLVQKTNYATTHGKYFEIDDSIDILVLQYEDYLGDLDEFMAKDATAVMEYLVANETANEKERVQWQSGANSASDCFSGTLDGNGVQIVGCYTGNGGIFSTVNEGAVLKNIEVSNGYFFAGWFASAFVGAVYQSNTYLATKPDNDTCYGRVDFENIILHDNYIKNSGNAQQSTGMLLGNVIGSNYEGAYYNHVGVTVDNCLTYDNKALAETGSGSGTFADHPYLFGLLSTSYNGMNSYPNGSYTNSIFLDCAPYAYTNSNQAFRAIYYTNVYTTVPTDRNPSSDVWYTLDQFDITVAEADDFKGETVTTTCSNFDWNDWVVDDTDYPEPRAFHDDITLVDNGDGTHSETCACGFGGVAVEHIYTNGVCACGAEVNCATRKTIAWDGTVATGFASGTGTKGDPYIIATAAQLAYLVKDYTTQASLDNSAGEYFKIDDSIGAIVLQPEAYASDIMALADAAAVKSYFEANAANMKKWVNEAWEQGAFCGTFDGNGATVYGLYQDTVHNAGLFTTVDAGCTIKNIAVKNSYMKSTTDTGGTYQVGGIAAVCAGTSYGAKNVGVVWFDNCIVANNYMTHDTTQASRCGTIIGAANAEAVYVTNCLVYGNDAKHADIDFPLVGEMANGATNASAIIPEGLTTTNRADNADFIANGIYDTITLGCAPYNAQLNLGNGRDTAEVYKNVYTDQAVGEIAFANGNRTYTEEQIKGITETDLAGLAIGDAWIGTDALPELKAFHDAEFKATPYAADKYAGHSLACSCGLAGAVEEHNYVVDDASLGLEAEYKCQDCGFVCDHMSADHNEIVETPRDCVNDYSLTVDCDCGFHYEEVMEAAYGHSFTEHDAVAGDDCQTNGTIAYKECTRCNKNYAADAAIDEPFENAITDLTGEKGSCIPKTDPETGDIIYNTDDEYHWTECSVCGEPGEKVAHDGDFEDNGAEGHSVVCDICGHAAANIPHNFNGDAVCDDCLWECTSHEYDHDCDTDCNICGVVREVEGHAYDNACDTDCNKCGAVREVPGHVYDHDCDTDCNECGAVREVEGHAYDNACDADCNKCGAVREVPGHVYDHDCDTDCNECGAVREVEGHAYDNACDTDCNKCGAVREVPGHVYDNDQDTDCNECGAVRVLAWDIDFEGTGAYTILPNEAYTAEFSTDDIVVTDQYGNEVKFNESKGGYPLVDGIEYTVEFTIDFVENVDGELGWNIEKVSQTIFTDVSSGEWYNDAVTYSVGAGIITGYGGTTNFGAADRIQRQDFVVILARLAGVDLSVYDDVDITFNDVADNQYYTNAILWAVDNGITTGYAGGTEFGVGDYITREQLVTFLYRYAKLINGGVAPSVSPDAADNAAEYVDYNAVNDYAVDAVIWAIDMGVIKGQNGTHIAPGGNALRCEVAQMMYNITINAIF